MAVWRLVLGCILLAAVVRLSHTQLLIWPILLFQAGSCDLQVLFRLLRPLQRWRLRSLPGAVATRRSSSALQLAVSGSALLPTKLICSQPVLGLWQTEFSVLKAPMC